jgi:hypothetical protein
MLVTMQEQTSTRSTRFIVLLIPTKELVYESFMAGRGSAGYDHLIQMEHTARAHIIETLESNQIEYVDALPALVAALNTDQAIYKNDIDGHPIAAGYNILAETLLPAFTTAP